VEVLVLSGLSGCYNGIESGDYRIATQEKRYVYEPASYQYIDLEAGDCPPVFQQINLSENLRIDMGEPSVIELDSTNDERFDLSGLEWEIKTRPSIGTPQYDQLPCSGESQIEFILSSDDEEQRIRARLWVVGGIYFDDVTKQLSGEIIYSLSNYFLYEEEETFVPSGFNPICEVWHEFLLEPIDNL